MMLSTNTKYIRRKYGEAGLNKAMRAIAGAGYTLPEVDKLFNLEWVPTGISAILICAYVEVFDWAEKEIFQMGYASIFFKKLVCRLKINQALILSR